MDKYLKLVKQTQNPRARLEHYKSAHRSFQKKRKVSQQHFHEYYGQHSHNGIGDWQFTLIEQFETHEQLKKRMIRYVIIMYFNPSSSIFITYFLFTLIKLLTVVYSCRNTFAFHFPFVTGYIYYYQWLAHDLKYYCILYFVGYFLFLTLILFIFINCLFVSL